MEIRRITVVGVDEPPPVPLRPLVSEVLRVETARQWAQARRNETGEKRAPARRTDC